MKSPEDFQRAAHKIGYTFNWLYVDDKDVAYFNSGNNPVRAKGVDPNFPVRARSRYEWRGYNPENRTARYTPFSAAPARRQPALHHELEQQAGARLQRVRRELGLLVGLPVEAARRQHPQADPRRREDVARRAGRRDGGGRHRRPARLRGPAVRAQGAAAGQQRPRAARRDRQAARLAARRRPPPRPQPRRRLRARRRDPHHGRLVAALDARAVRAGARARTCSTASRA